MREREYVFERAPWYGEAKEPNRKDYANYRITCKETEDIYYGVISGIQLDNKPFDELSDKEFEERIESVFEQVWRRTLGNPEIFIELCPPLYEDIVKYGIDNFKFWVQAFKTTRENAYYHQYRDIDRELICYNDFDDETFTGIKCIETEVIYKTAGEAARAYNLKSKNSILKALNDHTKTAAKMHWYSIDKATEERSRKELTAAEKNSQQEQQNSNLPPLVF